MAFIFKIDGPRLSRILARNVKALLQAGMSIENIRCDIKRERNTEKWRYGTTPPAIRDTVLVDEEGRLYIARIVTEGSIIRLILTENEEKQLIGLKILDRLNQEEKQRFFSRKIDQKKIEMWEKLPRSQQQLINLVVAIQM